MSPTYRPLVLPGLTLIALVAAACSGGGSKGQTTPSPSPSPTAVNPQISSVAPEEGIVDTTVTITGTNFGDTAGDVRFGGVALAVDSWTDTSIVLDVPDTLYPASYEVVVSQAGLDSDPASFAVVLPRAVYVHDDVDSVYGFSVDGAGALAPLAGSPYPAGVFSAGFGGDADSVRVHAGTRRIYGTFDTHLAAWDIDPRTGALTADPDSPYLIDSTATLFGVEVNAAGDRVYAADYSNHAVHVLALGTAGGLSPVQNSPFDDGAPNNWVVPKLTPDGAHLVVNDQFSAPSDLHVLAVGAEGELVAVTDSPFPMTSGAHAFGLEFSPAGRLYVADFGTSFIRVYDVDGEGVLAENALLATAVTDPNSLAITPDGTRLFAPVYDSNILHVFDVDGATGAMTPVTDSPFTLTPTLNAIVTDEDGGLLFAADELTGELSVFAIDAAGAPAAVGTPVGLDFTSPSGIDYSR